MEYIVYLFEGYAKCLLLDRRTTPHFLFINTLKLTDCAGVARSQKQNVMLKKIYFLIVAFVLGAILSLSFQACADDYDNEKPQVNTSGCNCRDNDKCHCGNQGGNSCNCSWGSQPMQYMETYYEDGTVSFRSDYEYDYSRLVKDVTIWYNKSSSGKRYLSSRNVSEYTYSSSGNIQYGNSVHTTYYEDGSVWNVFKTKTKRVLYKK